MRRARFDDVRPRGIVQRAGHPPGGEQAFHLAVGRHQRGFAVAAKGAVAHAVRANHERAQRHGFERGQIETFRRTRQEHDAPRPRQRGEEIRARQLPGSMSPRGPRRPPWLVAAPVPARRTKRPAFDPQMSQSTDRSVDGGRSARSMPLGITKTGPLTPSWVSMAARTSSLTQMRIARCRRNAESGCAASPW